MRRRVDRGRPLLRALISLGVFGVVVLAAASCTSAHVDSNRTIIYSGTDDVSGIGGKPVSTPATGTPSTSTSTSPSLSSTTTPGAANPASSTTVTSLATTLTTVPTTVATTLVPPTTGALESPDRAAAEDIAQQFLDAWLAGDRVAAGKVASPSAVAQLFAHPVVDRYQLADTSGGVGNYLCTFEGSIQDSFVQFWVSHQAGVPMKVVSVYYVHG